MRVLIFNTLVLICFLSVGVLGGKVSSPNPAYVCSFCVAVLGLVEEAAYQVHLERALIEKCGDSLICQHAVKDLVSSLESNAVPEDVCAEINMCTNQCKLFAEWPVNPLPSPPPEWPIERRLSTISEIPSSNSNDKVQKPDIPRSLEVLKPIFENALSLLPEGYGMWAHIVFAMGKLFDFKGDKDQSLAINAADGSCERFNISCKIQALVDHKPLQDGDGDYYSLENVRRMRGSDWRGYDCDDKRADVYPGRRTSQYDSAIDHNCNGIFGGNSTGLYEDLFCSGTEQRGLVILGDSATAHFHIPPQWITADNWNLDQLLADAENELDQPHCSWGTGHRSPEECPYQYPVPGLNGVVSLYTQLRERNRCNHNDFQNIGVNGARITSSMQLVNALARDQQNDHPLLVWLALIGNDICNGHPDFTHMTDPDEFYAKAMETLTALDAVVPPNSHVVSLALFDGELLYSTMHRHQHPVGTTYLQLYDFMNCLEENPCWGWLNSNATVRRISTAWSDALNMQYAKIEKTQNFKNFKFIFFSPKWTDIFDEYLATGRPLTDLIEPSDGFHPSQTGNAIFAQKFFQFLETEHPEAIGPINPHNAEIDAMFFSQNSKRF